MKPSKMLEFIKQWKSIERRRKDLDYEECRLCSEMRAEFPGGAAGGKRFSEWLDLELGIPRERQEECLERAASFAIIPDEQQWLALGGYVQIRRLIPLDRAERVAVIGGGEGERLSHHYHRSSAPIERGDAPRAARYRGPR